MSQQVPGHDGRPDGVPAGPGGAGYQEQGYLAPGHQPPEQSSPERRSPFDPDGVDFQPVDPALTKVRLISTVLWLGPLLIIGVVLALLVGGWGWWIGNGALAVTLLVVVLIVPRQVRAMGYSEAEEDLLFRKGILWRSLVIVPYGRMQQIDVEAGPLDRRFGVASVKLSTASAQTDAKIPGLPAAEAARLREALTTRGEARLAGL